MAYNYLIDLYMHLEHQINELTNRLSLSELSGPDKAYIEGMISEYAELEEFLKKNYNKMLPSKIRKKLTDHGPHGIN
jgi:hypothetical protein